jgi:predicted transcriptional regulator YdeE
MEPKTTRVSGFFVSGLAVRTMNCDELNQKTAKIPGLWVQFFSGGIADKIPDRLPDTPIFGVYSTYESDAAGSYNVTAGVSVTTLNTDFDSVEIQGGKYLVFDAIGPMPAAVIQTWALIWTYFEEHPQVKRSFLTDFESYCGPEEVQIHIGVAS